MSIDILNEQIYQFKECNSVVAHNCTCRFMDATHDLILHPPSNNIRPIEVNPVILLKLNVRFMLSRQKFLNL